MYNKRTKVNRRQFLQTSGLATVSFMLGTSGVVLFTTDGAWALEMKTFDMRTAKTLLVMVRTIYPHDTLADIYYAKVIGDLDALAAKNNGIRKMFAKEISKLNKILDVKFVDLSPHNRLRVLQTIETSAFFRKVRSTTVVSLYNQPLVWRHFGYEGPSWKFGGYIKRGFDDLNWLKQPPLDASPKAFIAETPLNVMTNGQ